MEGDFLRGLHGHGHAPSCGSGHGAMVGCELLDRGQSTCKVATSSGLFLFGCIDLGGRSGCGTCGSNDGHGLELSQFSGPVARAGSAGRSLQPPSLGSPGGEAVGGLH